MGASFCTGRAEPENHSAAGAPARRPSEGTCVLLVPEQYSFEAERQVSRQRDLTCLKGGGFETRLCNSVFRAHGAWRSTGYPNGAVSSHVAGGGRAAEHLKVYRKAATTPPFWKLSPPPARNLRRGAYSQGTGSGSPIGGVGQLRDKLSDLTALILPIRLCWNRIIPTPRRLLRARDSPKQHFEGACLFVDGTPLWQGVCSASFADYPLQGGSCCLSADGLQDTKRVGNLLRLQAGHQP